MIFGIVCIGYYIVICMYLGRMDSRFPRFWLALGGLSILFAWQSPKLPRQAALIICAAGAAVLILFVAVELRILLGMKGDADAGDVDYVIILGAKVDGTSLTDVLRERLDRGLMYLREHPGAKAVVSGGQGYGECVTEAYAMAQYLEKCGIAAAGILKEEHSTTTRENLILSGHLILSDKGTGAKDLGKVRIAVVTNNFHMYRAVCIARQVGYREVTALPAETTPVMFANYMVREFFGVLKMWIQNIEKRGKKTMD